MGWPKDAFLNLRQILTPKSRPAPGGNLLYVKDDNELYLMDSDGTEHSVSGSGAPVGTSIKDRRWTAGSGETSVDEHNDGSIAGDWTRVDTSGHAGYVAWTEDADTLSVASGLSADAAAELHAMVRPLSGIGGAFAVGDGIVAAVSNFIAGSLTIGGLIIADGTTVGSGDQVLCSLDASGGALTAVYHVMTGYNARTSFTAGSQIYGPSAFLRIARTASTTWRYDWSPDSVTWVEGSAFTSSIVPTHIGYAVSSWDTGVKGVLAFDSIRRVSGIT